MSILYCQGCGVDIAGEALLRNITFALEATDKAGLVGPNGAGKTTLIKAFLGKWPLESGQVHLSATVGYLPQNPSLHEGGTVFEAMLEERADLGQMQDELRLLEQKMGADEKLLSRYAELTERFEREGGYALEAQIRKILAGLGLSEERNALVKRLSGGQKTRLALGKLLLRSPELLVLDEPTNHLDIAALEWLESFLRHYAGAVLVVSHDRYFLNQVVVRIFHLENGRILAYPGNFTQYELQRALEETARAREAEKLGKKIARLEEYIRRNRAGVNAKQARGREAQLKKLEPVQQDRKEKELHMALSGVTRSGDRVLAVENLSLAYGARQLFQGVNLELLRGERAALLGRNGVGKTSLLKSLMQEVPTRGTIRLGANVVIGYYSQEHEGLSPLNSVIDEIRQASELYDPDIRSLLARYGFVGEDVFKPVRVLSGGEKSRLALCKLFLVKANFLLLDEPTNHLDGNTRDVLEEALHEFEGTLLVVSHDRYFIDKLVNKVLELTPKGLSIYEGDYTSYRENRQPKVEHLESRNKGYQQEIRAEQKRVRRIQQLESEIAQWEQKLERVEGELAQCISDYAKAMELQAESERMRTILNQAYLDWAEASEL